MATTKPKSIAELRKLLKPVETLYAEGKIKHSKMDILAIWITEHVGSMGFFMIIFWWTIIWLGWNTLGPEQLRFDPYPGFVLWLFISNMIQILLMPLIMVGQNQQTEHADARAEADFKVNIKAELEIETILQHLERQNDLILQILEKLEKQESK